MRIYEGSPRQDFEEVFRSIGAFLDARGMRDILLLEVPDGFVVQGLVTAGGSAGAWSDTIGTVTKETLTFLDDDIAKFMEEAVARRGAGAADGPRRRQPRAGAARDRPLDGRAEAARRVPVRAGRRVRRPAPRRGPGGLAPHARRVHQRRHPGPRRQGPTLRGAGQEPRAGRPRPRRRAPPRPRHRPTPARRADPGWGDPTADRRGDSDAVAGGTISP